MVKEIENESCLFTYIDARSLVNMQGRFKVFLLDYKKPVLDVNNEYMCLYIKMAPDPFSATARSQSQLVWFTH